VSYIYSLREVLKRFWILREGGEAPINGGKRDNFGSPFACASAGWRLVKYCRQVS
jgi:hypothetical protein